MSIHQFQVEPGLHTITASAPGYRTKTSVVDVQHDMTVEMHLDRESAVMPLTIIGVSAAVILILVLLAER